MIDAAACAEPLDLPRPSADWKRHVLPAMFGLSPLVTMALSWTPGVEGQTQASLWIKSFALPTLAAEILIIIAAFVYGRGARVARMGVNRKALLALVVVAIATASFAAPFPILAHLRTSIWIVHLLFAWALIRLCASGAVRSSDMVAWMIAGLPLFAAGLALFIANIENAATFNWMNNLAGLDHIRRIGYYGAPIVGLCLGRLALSTQAREQGLLLAVVVTGFTLFLWSGSRGPILVCFGAYAAGLLILPAMRGTKLGLQLVGSFLLSVGITHLLPTPHTKYGLGRLVESSDNPSSGRLEMWTDSLRAILERPLFGYGENQMRFILDAAQHYRVYHPHNLPLQVLLAWGFVGLLLIAIIAWPIGRRIIVETRASPGERLPLVMAIIVLLLFSAIDGTLFHVQSTAVFFACLAVLLALPAPDRTKA